MSSAPLRGGVLRWVPGCIPLSLHAPGKAAERAAPKPLNRAFPDACNAAKRSGRLSGIQRNDLPRSGAESRLSQRSPAGQSDSPMSASRSSLPPLGEAERRGGVGVGGGGWARREGDENDAAVGPELPSTPAPDRRRSASGKHPPPRSGFARGGPPRHSIRER